MSSWIYKDHGLTSLGQVTYLGPSLLPWVRTTGEMVWMFSEAVPIHEITNALSIHGRGQVIETRVLGYDS